MTVFPSPCAVIFDMDGLIFDTEALYQRALLQLAHEQGLNAINASTIQETVGLSWEATRELLVRLVGGAADTDTLIEKWMALYDELAEHCLDLKPGVTELLATLESRLIPRAIATGSYRAVALRHLETHNLAGYFSAVVAKEDCSNGKPFPDPFLAAAACLNVKPQDCWALEDSLNGVISAHAAGMKTIMVPDLVEPTTEVSERCIHIARSLHEVIHLLSD